MGFVTVDLPRSISNWNELVTYLRSQGLKVETYHILNSQNIKPGNHILLGGKPFKFLKIDTTNNLVYLEDLETTYTFPLLWFEQKFGGDLLVITGSDLPNYENKDIKHQNLLTVH